MTLPDWHYDETPTYGVDYTDPAAAAEYEERHSKFRDFNAETDDAATMLDLQPDDTLIDLGCGPGTISIGLAGRCRHVHAVDASDAILALARLKACYEGDTTMLLHESGFLTYRHEDERADAALSKMALHHLPDFWKLVALRNIASMLRPGGRFYLVDVVFPCSADGPTAVLERQCVKAGRQEFGPDRESVAAHFREEFSTFNWVMTGLLERAGFAIDNRRAHGDIMTGYVCSRCH